ncbi:MAG: hypothetical protein QOH12_3820 [Solirubrobacteraceae bacterium]|nr:hypothetical protein [Solirubrobacteraceae bacterium]
MRIGIVGVGLLAALGSGLSACGGGSTPRATSPPAGAGVSAAAGATAAAGAALPAGTTTHPAAAPAPSGPGLSQVQLAARAGAICSAATAQGRRLTVPSNMTTNPHAAAAYFDKAVPALDVETRALQALTPTAAVAAQWEAVIGAQVALDRLAQGYRQSAHAGRATSLADIRQLVTVGQTIANAAVRLGARCA